jgi:hypothetical protein
MLSDRNKKSKTEEERKKMDKFEDFAQAFNKDNQK